MPIWVVAMGQGFFFFFFFLTSVNAVQSGYSAQHSLASVHGKRSSSLEAVKLTIMNTLQPELSVRRFNVSSVEITAHGGICDGKRRVVR
jgi:hypothetical protein